MERSRRFRRMLEGKGHLKHVKGGRQFVYQPVDSRESAGKTAFQRAIRTFFEGSLEKAVAAYFGDPRAEVQPDELRRLSTLILDNKRNRAAVTRWAAIAALILLAVIVVPLAMLKAAPPERPANPAGITGTSQLQLRQTQQFALTPPAVPAIAPTNDGTNWPISSLRQSAGPFPAVPPFGTLNGSASSNDIAAIVDKLLNARGKVDWDPIVEQIAAYGDSAVPIITNRLADENATGGFEFALVRCLCRIGTDASLKPVRAILQDASRDQELYLTSRHRNEEGTRNLYWELKEAIQGYPTTREVEILPQVRGWKRSGSRSGSGHRLVHLLSKRRGRD